MSAHCMCLAHAHQLAIFFNLIPVYQGMIRPVHRRPKIGALGTRLGHDMLTIHALDPFLGPTLSAIIVYFINLALRCCKLASKLQCSI